MTHKYNFKYLLKTDDDCYLDVERILAALSNMTHSDNFWWGRYVLLVISQGGCILPISLFSMQHHGGNNSIEVISEVDHHDPFPNLTNVYKNFSLWHWYKLVGF